MFVFLQSKLKYFPKIFIFEQGVLFVKLSFVNIMVRKIICSEISAITVTHENKGDSSDYTYDAC